MKILVLVCFVAYARAVPAAPSIYADVYKNILPSSSRIIGGQEAERNQFPHQLSLQWGMLGVYSHICGATLITESWGLTAGHCKAYSVGSYRVVAGLLYQNEQDHPDVQTIGVKKFIVHPKYPGGAEVAANDIALVNLKTAVKITPAVQVAPLPKSDECDILEGANLSGWGLTSWLPIPPNPLYWTQMPRISNEQCAADLTVLLGNSGPLDDSMICTSANPGVSQSACSGDSGGPLVLPSNNTVIGVVSWGITPCGTKGAPTVFTRVCSHLDFIHLYI